MTDEKWQQGERSSAKTSTKFKKKKPSIRPKIVATLGDYDGKYKKLSTEKDWNITIQRFPGATVNRMKDCMQPTIDRKPPAKIVIHAGANGLSTGIIHLVHKQNFPEI